MRFLPVFCIVIAGLLSHEVMAQGESTNMMSLDIRYGYGWTVLKQDADNETVYGTNITRASLAIHPSPQNSIMLSFDVGILKQSPKDSFTNEGMFYTQQGIAFRRLLTPRFSLGVGYSFGDLKFFTVDEENEPSEILVSGYQRLHLTGTFSLLKGKNLVKALNVTNEIAAVRFNEAPNDLNLRKAAFQNIVSLEMILVPTDSKWNYRYHCPYYREDLVVNALQFMIDIPTDLFTMAIEAI